MKTDPIPFCLMRGFINTIQAITSYNAHDWINPKLWYDGSFTIFLQFVDGFGHDDLDLIAEAATRFENEFKLPNGSLSIRFFSKTGEKFSTVVEINVPYLKELTRFSKHLFDVREEWYPDSEIDEFIVQSMFQYFERDDDELSQEYIYEIDEETLDIESAITNRQTILFDLNDSR